MAVKNLLLIDDSDIDNLVNQRMVEKTKFARNVVIKKSARSGLDYLEKTFTKDKEALPEIIFLDIRMPDMDGFAFLEAFIGLDPFVVDWCKIVLLTSSIDADDYRRAKESPNVIKFVNKPLTEKILLDLGF